MHHWVFQYLYDQLKEDSVKSNVDNWWTNLLPLYFDIQKNYGIERNTRPWAESRISFIIQAVRDGKLRQIALIQTKPVSLENDSAAWTEAAEEVTGYMKTIRAAQYTIREAKLFDKPLYAIVNIGRYTRFYTMLPTESTLREYGTGQRYEHKEDEELIDGILLELADKTL